MKLYKNVDVCDLKSILEKGILPLSVCKNYNWEAGKRADNDTDVVYLFTPCTQVNSLVNFGIVLLEVDCDDAEMIRPEENETRSSIYKEYTTPVVKPEQIRRILIPRIFQPKIEDFEGMNVTWCEMDAEYYSEREHDYVKCDESIMKLFAETAEITSANSFNFFRGEDSDRRPIDLRNVRYYE